MPGKLPQPTRLSAWEPLKWALFRALEKLSDLRGNAVAMSEDILPQPAGQPALWVFVSTIGELNAVGPFLGELVSRLAHLRLVLITDHEHYRNAYLAQYPDATVFVSAGHSEDAKRLARHLPPAMLVLGEIPCLPSDAPCRFSYAFIRAAKKAGARIALVNGWLYHNQPSCLMDSVERRLFASDYVDLLDAACVQNEAVRDVLIQHGASPDHIAVTGNIKFDALAPSEWTPDNARSSALLRSLLACKRPIIVAGCVTDPDEQAVVLDAFLDLRTHQPRTLLVLAPRHPEKPEVLKTLFKLLDDRQIPHRCRSGLHMETVPGDIDCLILDTIGELRDFYAVSSLAYVGRDHNILEPLTFAKATIVRPGWNCTYPSYPVYLAMLDAGGIHQVENAAELSRLANSILNSPATRGAMEQSVRHSLQLAAGATERCLQALEPLLKRVSLGPR